MPRIPRYQQEKLASQLVGTPGIDQTGNVLSESMLRGANAQAESALYAQRQEQARDVQAQKVALGLVADIAQGVNATVAYKRAADSHLKTLQNDAFTNHILYELAKEDLNTRKAISQDKAYLYTTAGADQRYEQDASSTFRTVSERYQLNERPEIMAKVSSGWETIKKNGYANVRDFQVDRDTEIAKRNQLGANADTEELLMRAESLDEVKSILNNHNLTLDNAYLTMGAEGRLAMQESQRKGLLAFSERSLRKTYDIDPANLYANLDKDPAILAVAEEQFSQLKENDVQHLRQLANTYKNAAIEKQKNLIDWQNLGTEFQVDKIAIDAVQQAILTGDKTKAAEAFVQLNRLREIEENKPIEWRSKRLTDAIESEIKFLANLNVTMQSRELSRQDRAVSLKRQEINDQYSAESRTRTLENVATQKARKEGVPTELAIREGVNKMLGLINAEHPEMIKTSDIRDLGTKLKDAYARDYISREDYIRYQNKIGEIGEAVAPDSLKRESRIGMVEGWLSSFFNLDVATAKKAGASNDLINIFNITRNSPEELKLSKEVEDQMDLIINKKFKTKEEKSKVKGVLVDEIKLEAERQVFHKRIQGQDSTYVKPSVVVPKLPLQVPPPPPGIGLMPAPQPGVPDVNDPAVLRQLQAGGYDVGQ